MTADEVRAKFLDFFQGRGHTVLKSSGLVPKDDPTLLFTNAGMVQFKRVFTGEEKRDYRRAATSQKCVRAGGKHNDLENVGYTTRHHTFFEMLGNFSFGDYFKAGAIEFAWSLLVDGYGLPADRLHATIFQEDDEAFDLWRKIVGLPTERIHRLGEKDNFWAMGDTGPCGPCSEIIIDQGPSMGCGQPDCAPGCDCDRFLELWNLVFMQFERAPSGSMTPLPRPSIDTGMGLERITAVVSGRLTNFETDLFVPLIDRIQELSGIRYLYRDDLAVQAQPDPKTNVSMRVIADHARALTFLIGDGVLPENIGRGYVLRRILRRAVRHGRMLGLTTPFLDQVSGRLVEIMGGVYPELGDGVNYIKKIILSEEERFSETLDNGLKLLAEEMDRLKETAGRTISGEVAFKLYDTYGFPLDLVADVGRENGLGVDLAGFEAAMAGQREKSRASWKGSGEAAIPAAVSELTATGFKVKFVGYDHLQTPSKVVLILSEGRKVDQAVAGEVVSLVTEVTPFYGAAGGQVGDVGRITFKGGAITVTETIKYPGDIVLHLGQVEAGQLIIGQTVSLDVSEAIRGDIRRNHTATHLLHKVLREELGDHVKQAGSLVSPDRLRFDFTHFSQVPLDVLRWIEARVNEKIRENLPVVTTVMSMTEAMGTGATALFEERYGDTVRVVAVGDFSMELCGGTHVTRTGDIGAFVLSSEGSAAAGVRRIEALTGRGAIEDFQAKNDLVKSLAERLKTQPDLLLDRLEKVLDENKDLKREIDKSKHKAASSGIEDLLAQTQEIGEIKFLAAKVEAEDPKALRELGDRLKDKLRSGVIALGAVSQGKVMLLVMVTPGLPSWLHAGNLIKEMAPEVGGRGGGRPDMAQAGGANPDGLDRALAKFRELLNL